MSLGLLYPSGSKREDLAVAEPLVAHARHFNTLINPHDPGRYILATTADLTILHRATTVLEAVLMGLLRDMAALDLRVRKLAKECWEVHGEDVVEMYQQTSLLMVYNLVADHEAGRSREPGEVFRIPSSRTYPPSFPSVTSCANESPELDCECAICLDPPTNPVLTPCNHVFCQNCIENWVIQEGKYACPACRARFSRSHLRLVDELLRERQRGVPAWVELLRLVSTEDGEECVGRGEVHEWFWGYEVGFLVRFGWV
ncbi:hypothetical protein HYALB_00007040 [Hymenoscyphus albidus]|uniref:RING-type E3 ubiquitin transferase n=1 Tax=Hymenoscyphus albidus TaxID=595503 RepID=A0A9N9LQM9_9HELO|nr:hypothetical protein HYALB_00007040 [Hymenoscyphus albidus]